MSKTKESKDGWIRHRGGKCPVAKGVIVEVRFRSGEVEIDSDWPRWEHNGGKRDIMAYRIFETSQQVENSPTSDIQNAQEDEGDPLVWRDRIYELAAQQEEITKVYNRQSSEIAAERESLIQRLESEGFRLIDGPVETATHAEDMNDWRNWRVGDMLEFLADDPYETANLKGDVLPIVELESGEYDGQLPAKVKGGWPYLETIKWHSRQSA